MKKYFLFAALLTLTLGLSAQLPVSTKVKTLGAISDQGIGAPSIATFNAAKTDTLKSGDTLFYKVLINHGSVGYPYISQLTKLVANDTTATATFWQSVDGSTNWQQIKYLSQTTTLVFDTTKYAKGTTGKFWDLYSASGTSVNAETVWSVTVNKSTTTGTNFSFWRQNAKFESQYLGIRFIASTKSGFKTIYYGSVRFEKGN